MDNWIKTSERLPKVGEEVITCNRFKRVQPMLFGISSAHHDYEPYFYNEWRACEIELWKDKKSKDDQCITHWMPLPKPPETP